ncbi:glycosyltransferase family 4 protein [Brachybacterium sp.]|uniref:glycosyltransferase family 4 protein n=1 Tax=Brachybacterium sp. TaxID=1891286 RepID=UPI003F8FB18B
MTVSSRAAPTILAAHSGAGLFTSDRMLLESVRGLREVGCRVVVALPSAGPLIAELERAGAEIEIVSMLVLGKNLLRPRRWPATTRRALLGLRSIRRLIRRIQPDVIYVSTTMIPQWPLLARHQGIRSISHIHEVAGSGNRWLDRLLYLPHLASQRTLVSSRASLETMRRALPAIARRSEIVHNGITSPRYPAPPREPLEPPLRILYMGRLSPRKGPDLALEAASLIQQEGRRVELTMLGTADAGDEWFEDQLRNQAAGSGVEVDFAGLQRDIWPHLARADILLAPSRFDEPFGNSAVEAVLALRPVIASDSSALREAAGGYRTTRLVPPGDARAIGDALVDVTDSWSSIVHSLRASRNEALRRHDPEGYRATINRACGAESRGSWESTSS